VNVFHLKPPMPILHALAQFCLHRDGEPADWKRES
jgi:hypothetical protein